MGWQWKINLAVLSWCPNFFKNLQPELQKIVKNDQEIVIFLLKYCLIDFFNMFLYV